SGKGFVRIPYLGNIKLAVHYDNILLNTDRQLLQGTVVTEYDPTMRNILDTKDVVETVGEIANSIKELLESFTGTPEQIQQLQEENQEQGNYVEELLADESIPQNVRNELEANYNAYNASSQNLITEATQGGPNPDGYDTANQIQAYNALENSIKKAESYKSGTNAEDEFGLEVSFSDNDLLELGVTVPTQKIFLSPAGIPVVLPDGATPAFYKVRTNVITAYGALASFTMNDGSESTTYYGHKKGTQFTGYKIAKDSTAYEFGTLPVGQSIRARIIDKGLVPTCSHLFYEGDYYTNNINSTGTGTLATSFNFTGNLDLLTIDEQGYSDCLPTIDYERFTDYVVGIYNYFGQGGFTRKTMANDGTTAYLHSVLDDEGILRHYQYNTGNGLWQQVKVPTYDVDTAGSLNYLFGQVFSSAAGHLVLDMAGMAPIAGEVFDALNGACYTIEGDTENATISFASTIPLVFASTVKNVGKLAKLADGTTVVVKFSEGTTQQLVNVLKRLNLDAAQLKKLGDDLVDKEFVEAIAENPELVDSWKHLDGIGAGDALRRNPEALGKVKNYLDNQIDIVKQDDQIKALTKNGDEIGDLLDNGLVKGKYSKRPFDPSEVGGDILRLSYKNAVVSKSGIADIKIHLSRLDPDDWNPAMIKRLEDIEAGKIQATDFDKRFYTHELRELERARSLGLGDTHKISYDEWNNLHSATLEDYQLFEKIDFEGESVFSLYHPSVQN
nr:hypothetical protein [Flagellimonas sp. 389]